MKNIDVFHFFGCSRKSARSLSAVISGVIVLLGQSTIIQDIFAFLRIKRYMSLDELGQLYCETAEEKRLTLRSLLDQVAIDFRGWLEFFRSSRPVGAVRTMVVDELVRLAKSFSERQMLLINFNLEKTEKMKILEAVKQDAKGWSELIFVLRFGFDRAVYNTSVDLARGNKDMLMTLWRLDGVDNYRRAYLCQQLLKIEDLSGRELLEIYQRLDKRSRLRRRVLSALENCLEPFSFWMNVFQKECNNLKNISLNKLSNMEVDLESMIYCCNHCRDKRLISMVAMKLEKEELPSHYWGSLYESTASFIPEIQNVILEKQRIAVAADENMKDSYRLICLRSLFMKSIRNQALSERIMADIISFLPNVDRFAPPVDCHARRAQLSFIANVFQKSDARFLKKMMRLLAPKITDHEEWIHFSIQFRSCSRLQKIVIEGYKRFFIKDFCSNSPLIKTTNTDLRNRRVCRAWKPVLNRIAA